MYCVIWRSCPELHPIKITQTVSFAAEHVICVFIVSGHSSGHQFTMIRAWTVWKRVTVFHNLTLICTFIQWDMWSAKMFSFNVPFHFHETRRAGGWNMIAWVHSNTFVAIGSYVIQIISHYHFLIKLQIFQGWERLYLPPDIGSDSTSFIQFKISGAETFAKIPVELQSGKSPGPLVIP